MNSRAIRNSDVVMLSEMLMLYVDVVRNGGRNVVRNASNPNQMNQISLQMMKESPNFCGRPDYGQHTVLGSPWIFHPTSNPLRRL